MILFTVFELNAFFNISFTILFIRKKGAFHIDKWKRDNVI